MTSYGSLSWMHGKDVAAADHQAATKSNPPRAGHRGERVKDSTTPAAVLLEGQQQQQRRRRRRDR